MVDEFGSRHSGHPASSKAFNPPAEVYLIYTSKLKYLANDTNSPSGRLLPSDMSQGDKQCHKERKEHREKCRAYRKYSELTPPSVQSCYDNYGFVFSLSIKPPSRSSPIPTNKMPEACICFFSFQTTSSSNFKN